MRFVSVWYSSPTHGQPSNLLSGHRSSSKNSFTYWTIYYYKRFIIWRHISSSKLLYLYHLPDSIGILSKGKLREKRLTEFLRLLVQQLLSSLSSVLFLINIYFKNFFNYYFYLNLFYIIIDIIFILFYISISYGFIYVFGQLFIFILF